MSKDKRQLRAEAVERLREYHDWEPSQKSLANITLPIWPMSTYMSNDQRVDKLIDLLIDDEQPDTFHDDFYDCESTVDASEDSREKLEADARDLQARIWLAGATGDGISISHIIELLDRQAAIIEREGREAWHKAASGEIYQVKQEADELRAKYNDMLERRTKVECDCDCCKWQEDRDELRRQVSELRELNDSLHARIESAREALS